MKITFSGVSFWKYADLAIQVLAFLVMLLLFGFFDWGPFSFFVEAAVQLISCLIWLVYFRRDVPRYRAGVFIRYAFLIVATVWITASLCSDAAFAVLLYLMLFFGPVMGIAYFVIKIGRAHV